MSKLFWSKELLIKLVEEKRSIRQVIIGLGLIPAGGNYSQIKKYIRILELDTNHFTGMGWNKGKKVDGVV